MIRKIFSICVLMAAVLFVFTGNAYADIGLPMVFLGIPFLVLAFIPVFFIEAFIYREHLKLSFKRSGIGSFLANVLTTLVGYPVSWILHVAVTMVVGYPLGYALSEWAKLEWMEYALFPLMSAWLMPGVSPWQIYLAGIFGLIPAFWLSVWIEGRLLLKLFAENKREDIKQAVWRANKATYLLLALFLGVMCAYHSLVELHAFDIFRDRSDEQVSFQMEPQEDLLVSSGSGFYLLDPSERVKDKIDIHDLKKSRYGRFEESLLKEKEVWFTIDDFDKTRNENLYKYELDTKKLTKISSWKNVNDLAARGEDVFVFVGAEFAYDKDDVEESAICKVAKDDKVGVLYEGGLTPRKGGSYLSPNGEKVAYVKMTGSRGLGIYRKGPYFLTAQVRVYNFDQKNDVKIADVAMINDFKNVEGIHVSWHPGKNTVYFSDIDRVNDFDSLMKVIRLEELKEKYGDEGQFYESEKAMAVVSDIFARLDIGIYQYDLDTDEKGLFHAGHSILGWSPNSEAAIVAKGLGVDDLIYVDMTTGKSRLFSFQNLRRESGFDFSWSKDGKFIAYLGDSEHFLDKHHYSDGMYWRNKPGWVWIKEITTGKERKFDAKPINPAFDILWRQE
ncbi:MAG: hypothetical protein KAR05_08165 [Candidatus Omnitrophica bacterium]|nr:hypothetical protein [Candidatus Omnitrophota bacterium]